MTFIQKVSILCKNALSQPPSSLETIWQESFLTKAKLTWVDDWIGVDWNRDVWFFFLFFFCCRFFWKAGAGRGSKRRTKREKKVQNVMAKIEIIVFSICLVFLHPIWPLWDPFRFSSVFTYWQIFILKNVFYSWRHGFCRKFWSWSKAKRKRERNKKESRIAALKYVSRAKKVTL